MIVPYQPQKMRRSDLRHWEAGLEGSDREHWSCGKLGREVQATKGATASVRPDFLISQDKWKTF
jgi:hypothetical protein